MSNNSRMQPSVGSDDETFNETCSMRAILSSVWLSLIKVLHVQQAREYDAFSGITPEDVLRVQPMPTTQHLRNELPGASDLTLITCFKFDRGDGLTIVQSLRIGQVACKSASANRSIDNAKRQAAFCIQPAFCWPARNSSICRVVGNH